VPTPRDSAAVQEPPGEAAECAAPVAPAAEDRLGRFTLLELIGEGSFGLVYRAHDPQLDRVVALKVAKPEAHDTRERVDRFLQEARAAAALRHPHIVPVFDAGQDGGRYYIASAFIDGPTLASVIDSEPLSPRRAAEIIRVLAGALAYAHGRGFVHQDVKPSNVLMDGGQHPVLADFGLAARRVVSPSPGAGGKPSILPVEFARPVGEIAGTPEYMAPEQAIGQPVPASDQYSLGAVLYELMAGHPPFAGPPQLVLFLHRTQKPPRPRRNGRRMPRDLEAICLKALAKEPGHRFASNAAMADDLGRFLNREPVKARRAPPWERVAKWAWRRPAQAALATVSVLAALSVLGGAGVYALYKDQQAQALRGRLETVQKIEEFRARGGEEEAAGRLPAAVGFYEQAAALLDTDPDAPHGLRGDVRDRRDRVARPIQQQQEVESERREWGGRIASFRRDRDDILFYAIPFSEADRAGNRARVLTTAPRAVAALGFDAAVQPGAGYDLARCRRHCESDATFGLLIEGCYQVLLVWADTEARTPAGPDPAAAGRALALLDRAAALAAAHRLATPQAYHQRRAGYLEAAGDAAGARAERTKAAQLEPHTNLDRFLTALDLFQQGSHLQAARRCEEILDKEPDHYWAGYLQALSFLKAGRWAEAKPGLTACVRERPGDAFWPLLLRASAHSELGEYADADADFQAALKLAAGPHARWIVLTNRGAHGVRQKHWEAAAADLREAIGLFPDRPEPYVNLAQADVGRAEPAAAVRDLDAALALRQDPALLLTRATLHLERGERALARQDLERIAAAGNSPSLAKARVELAHLQHLDHDYTAALESCDAALRAAPDFPPALRQRADTLLALGRDEEAGETLDRYLQSARSAPDVLQARGLLYMRRRRYADAVEAFDRALALRPDAATLTSRGWAYLRLDAPKLALPDFEAALRADAGSAEALCGRGRCRVLLGKTEDGVADAEAALARARQPTARLLYNAAAVHAQATLALENATGSAGTAQIRSQERAVELLRRALEKIPERQRADFWRENVQKDKAFQSLRRSTSMGYLSRSFPH
jgi:tetratricopeptide (TPR) repeat protein